MRFRDPGTPWPPKTRSSGCAGRMRGSKRSATFLKKPRRTLPRTSREVRLHSGSPRGVSDRPNVWGLASESQWLLWLADPPSECQDRGGSPADRPDCTPASPDAPRVRGGQAVAGAARRRHSLRPTTRGSPPPPAGPRSHAPPPLPRYDRTPSDAAASPQSSPTRADRCGAESRVGGGHHGDSDARGLAVSGRHAGSVLPPRGRLGDAGDRRSHPRDRRPHDGPAPPPAATGLDSPHGSRLPVCGDGLSAGPHPNLAWGPYEAAGGLPR